MTTVAAPLTPADRERLLKRLRELRELDKLMREPGTLAAPRPGQHDQDDQDDRGKGTTPR